ncbi:hypothetical protein NQZ68_025725 [Dissostichus eleginoides]|nr:hypothetical protein NQZ68_025725 [Dissostichus eleginoides]
MDVVGRLRRKSIVSRCPRCGKYGPAYSTIRISTAEMESYHHFVGVCKETDDERVFDDPRMVRCCPHVNASRRCLSDSAALMMQGEVVTCELYWRTENSAEKKEKGLF